MRASFVFSEVLTGLRRNFTMTIAMILTTAISLTTLGAGLLIVRAVGEVQENFASQTEVQIFLTNDSSATDTSCSQSPCADLKSQLQNTYGVREVNYENRHQVFERFKKIFAAQPQLVELTREQALPATLHVKTNPGTPTEVLAQQFKNRPGVKSIGDQGQFVRDLFSKLNTIRDVAFGFAVVLAVAALLLISNTVQLSAFNRRTEVGIMRLVGATRWYTQLPFLLEAVVSGLVGAVIGIGGLLALVGAVFGGGGSSIGGIVTSMGIGDVLLVSPILLGVSIVISALTGYVTLRLYVRH
ncbi:permease-like cell division protein FtsX [Sciscionella sediminilitoris]|uniref:permease-like cell division protein FtsX n=1 Tax=Sciscionella sediminilitoris TaxID=1445613 RepID=UPI0004DF651B|nr:permease-like cell division protein FtsX [Sciscionella sp. SE31]